MKSSKEALRLSSKQKRAKLFSDGRILEISKRIVKNILELEEFKSAKNVMLFYPKDDEIDLLGLLSCKDKEFYLPRCEQDVKTHSMCVCKYQLEDELQKSRHKIYEPICEALKDLSVLDIVFVPALCADKNCNRIGYGAGYYDNFFKENKNLKAKKIIVLAKDLMAENIPIEAHDIPCDMLITEH